MKTEAIKYSVSLFIGKTLKFLGFKYGVSTCIAEYATYGYGKLDHNGFWQFPCKAGS